MLSHLFHRRAPSNPTSPIPEHAPGWDAVAQREHPQQPPRDVSPRPDTRPRSPNSSKLPPTLPPITRVASSGSDHFFTPQNDAPPPSQDTRQVPARAGYSEENKAGFIGGVALQNYRKAAREPQQSQALQGPGDGMTMAGQVPGNQLSRSKPPPPPINTGVAALPAAQGNKHTKSSWFSTPTDLQGSGGGGKRPAGTRLISEPAFVPASEPQKGRKGLPFLKNPMSSLLMRRKTAHSAVETQPLAPTYDPRIKGTRVHDFSAPRPKKTLSGDAVSTTKQEGVSPISKLADGGEAGRPSFTGGPTVYSPAEPAQGAADVLKYSQNCDPQLGPEARRMSSSTVRPGDSVSLAPPGDASSLRTSSSGASGKTRVATRPSTTSTSIRTTASRQLSKSNMSRGNSVASAVPKHMKSTSSRFSFDMIGAAEEERVLEERHRQREQDKKTSDGPSDSRFDELDEDYDYDAMMDDGGLEEEIPGVNVDYDDYDGYDDYGEADPEADLDDPDNDQENFAGFTFQRSNPVSALASPHTPAMLATPRDAAGQRYRLCHDQGHYPHHRVSHGAATQIAAASGKFARSASPEALAASEDTALNELDGYEDAEDNGYIDDYADDLGDGFDDFDFDDEAIIAEANASALANDSDGFYGQEFGFYSAPLAHQSHGNSHHQPAATTTTATSSSGVLTSENLFQYANGGFFGSSTASIDRSGSGRVVREPNLTPITERSEYSNRNSVMSFTLPPAISSERNSMVSPPLAQLALLAADADADDPNMQIAALMKRRRAWGGSQPSLVSSREGSPRSERASLPPLDGGGSPYGTVPAHLAGHVRVNSNLSLLSSSEVAEDSGRHTPGSGMVSPVPPGLASGMASLRGQGLAQGIVLPPRPGSAGAVVNGSGSGGGGSGTDGMTVPPLPQRPHSLFLPPQSPLSVLSPTAQPMPVSGPVPVGGSACSPVLEGEEVDGEGVAVGGAIYSAGGYMLAPALPLRAGNGGDAAELSLQQQQQQQQGFPRQQGVQHVRKGSAESVSYHVEKEDGGTLRFISSSTNPQPTHKAGTKEMWSGGGFPSIGGFGGLNRCRGCDHPRPAYTGGYSSVRSNLGTMLTHSKYIGCEVCTILSDGILKFLEDNSCGVTRDDVNDVHLDFNLAATRRSIEVVLLQTPVKLTFYASEITPWLADNMPDLPVGKEIPSTTASEETLAWAVRELDHCRQNHEACNSFPPAPLPSRVLDLRADGESGVRLYVSQGETSPYVALSHCWGPRPFLRTLTGSLDEHKAEIAWSRLPRNFQDAIEFTRKLGIRYLWIDSLCIIQDDIEDWRYEAAQMGSVYRNATLVISAAKSESAYGGLYAEMPEKHRTYTVTFTPGQDDDDDDDDDDRSTSHCNSDDETNNITTTTTTNNSNPPKPKPPPEQIHFRVSLSHPHRLLSHHHAPTSSLPIFTRGWILQERFLSPRILHFGPEELSLECLTTTTCQCTPPTLPRLPHRPSASPSPTLRPGPGFTLHVGPPRPAPHQ
ncbi:hypothetical protein CHGG_10589 [Chaetomium globosum CBS 148.51]|uniref:Heterokaryon incompatibility domain-containing protein n=1 Tax=Chaetomium globosum (strain ATCC 6205 / CBS 148.51 / DSM 1962 / NBRC 6347 / NRRL 1970) TaxID=306901 RepID=Q2GN65_CHAGB|nr:uncharacterized protein CHGG_10589 [Chaetomium globosum CBS 148.51]EAQ84185.1 hypothetical protein CHGG_10589 [Chaetomium globosum CBS 148.51]